MLSGLIFYFYTFLFEKSAFKLLVESATNVAYILFGTKKKIPILVQENFLEKAHVQVVEMNVMMQTILRFKEAFEVQGSICSG